MNSTDKLTFCSGVGTVTGSNFLLETSGGSRILVDCGLVQGPRIATAENYDDFIYDPASIDVLLITHAHLDHVGRIPKLVRDGFRGKIYSTPETRALGELVLNDAVGILHNEAMKDHREPLYEREDVAKVYPLWRTVAYHEEFEPVKGAKVQYKNAGHILGSAMIEIVVAGKKILFTGDLGNTHHPLLKGKEDVGDPDFLIMESVYGDRNHESLDLRTEKLQKVIKDTLSRGGTLVIPAFSVDRTQVFLYELNNLVEEGKIPSVPVFLDSPMATEATRIYQSSLDHFNEKVQEQIRKGDAIFDFPKLQYTVTTEESKDIDHIKGSKIILAGSGMSAGGRVIAHESNYLPDPRNTILLVGYQTAGSLGRQLAEGATSVNINGRPVKVKARIESIYGYSAHCDSDHLVEFVAGAKKVPKDIFVVMGEPKSAMHLVQRLKDELGLKAMIPERGKVYEIK